MSVTSSTAKASTEIPIDSLAKRGEKVTYPMKDRAKKHLDRMERGMQAFAIIAVVALVAAIVLLGLSQADYVHPLSALYSFSGALTCLAIAKMIDCCHQSVAKKNHIDRKRYYALRQPPFEEKKGKGKKRAKRKMNADMSEV